MSTDLVLSDSPGFGLQLGNALLLANDDRARHDLGDESHHKTMEQSQRVGRDLGGD